MYHFESYPLIKRESDVKHCLLLWTLSSWENFFSILLKMFKSSIVLLPRTSFISYFAFNFCNLAIKKLLPIRITDLKKCWCRIKIKWPRIHVCSNFEKTKQTNKQHLKVEGSSDSSLSEWTQPGHSFNPCQLPGSCQHHPCLQNTHSYSPHPKDRQKIPRFLCKTEFLCSWTVLVIMLFSFSD